MYGRNKSFGASLYHYTHPLHILILACHPSPLFPPIVALYKSPLLTFCTTDEDPRIEMSCFNGLFAVICSSNYLLIMYVCIVLTVITTSTTTWPALLFSALVAHRMVATYLTHAHTYILTYCKSLHSQGNRLNCPYFHDHVTASLNSMLFCCRQLSLL